MGNKRGHKGGTRRFTNPAEIAARKEKEEREKEWRRRRGEVIESDEEDEDQSQDDSEEEEEEDEKKKQEKLDKIRESARKKQQEEDEEEEEDESEEDDEPLIEICNPNRVQQKVKKDVNALANEKVILSRKEKEQLAAQKGKTKEVREDLARLALIREKRTKLESIEKAKKQEMPTGKPPVAATSSTSSKAVSKKK